MTDTLLPSEAPPVVSEGIPPAFQAPDIADLLRKGTHFTEKRGDTLHVVEAATGNSLALLESHHRIPTHFVRYENPDGTITWCQEGIAKPEPNLRALAFSPLVIDEICRRIVEGEGLTNICGKPGMPTYNEFCRWRRAHAWIEDHLRMARSDRAEKLRDEAIQIADQATDARDTPAKQLRAEVRKWAASVDNERYNPRTKVEATINAPTAIIVHTGIQRDVTPEPTKALPPGSDHGG